VGHEHLSETVYQRRLRAIDALVLPFAPEGMLTTGTVFDAMAAGVAVISSRWGFIEETLGDAAIYYGSGSGGSGSGGSGSGGSGGGGSGSGGSASESLAACLEQITRADLAAGAEAVGALRSSHDWGDIGDQTLALFNELVP